MIRFILIGLLAGTQAWGAFEWEQQNVKLQVHATQIAATAVFHFTNTGTEPAALGDVHVSCSCLFVPSQKKIYAPGESGELPVEFNLRNRTGRQRKALLVENHTGQPTRLFVEADIPAAFVIEPRMLQWKKGDSTSVKTARLTNPNDYPVTLHGVTSSNAQLPAELHVIREGFEYEIAVTRNGAGSNSRSVVRIETSPPPGESNSKLLKLYVHVQ